MNKRFGKFLFIIFGSSLIFTTILNPSANASAHSKTNKALSPVYAFKSQTLTNTNFNGEELAGKPAVLWFWTPWCTICRSEAPDLAELANSFNGRVKVIGVAGLGPVSDMKQFVKETRTSNFVHLADTDGAIWLHFQIPSQPSFIFITSKGTISRKIGALSKSDLLTRTKALLKKS